MSSASTTTKRSLTPHPTLSFDPTAPADAAAHVLVGRKQALLAASSLLPPELDSALWKALVESVKPGDAGDTASTLYTRGGGTGRITAVVLPEPNSRHNSPVRAHAISALAGKPAASGAAEYGAAAVTLLLDDVSHASAAACALARGFPLYTSKHGRGAEALQKDPGQVRVTFAQMVEGGASAGAFGPLSEDEAPTVHSLAARAAAGVRLAARLVDTPCEELGTLAFVAEAQETASMLRDLGASVDLEVISGVALRDGGFGGIWNVGRAATEPPALVILSYTPSTPSNKPPTALVGKGIVYDTGGLGLKVEKNIRA